MKLRDTRLKNIELKDTIDLMLSNDYKERFKTEYYQDRNRTEGLERMLEAYKVGTLSFIPKCSYELLYEQPIYMRAKLKVLEERAFVENISLF